MEGRLDISKVVNESPTFYFIFTTPITLIKSLKRANEEVQNVDYQTEPQ